MSESCLDHHGAGELDEPVALDPRIKVELELLNTASAEINRLEKQLDESRQAFRQTLTESSQSLNEKIKKCRKSAAKAQGYYAAKEEARKAQEMAQEAALRYQRASGMYSAAKETIVIAEEAALSSKTQTELDSRRRFDSALQEMLNLSTEKLTNAEREKRESQHEHEKRSRHYIASQQVVDQLAKKFKRSINKSAEYYELKKSFFYELNDLKTRIEALQIALAESKTKYRGALKHLEQISEDIHQSRQVAAILAGSRQSGVGADSNAESETEHEKLDITFHIDDSTDGESIVTDSSDATSSCTSPPPVFHRMPPRSVSGSSLPSPPETDVEKTQTRSPFNFTTSNDSYNKSNGNSKRDSVPKIAMDTVDDVEDDLDDDDDIFIGVEIESDSDDDNDKNRLNVTRKLRTISIGDLKSFSVYDEGDEINIDASTTPTPTNTISDLATSEQPEDQTNEIKKQSATTEVSETAIETPVDTVVDTIVDTVNDTMNDTVNETVNDDAQSRSENKDSSTEGVADDKSNEEIVWI